MPKPLKTNWKIVSGLLLLGALPALPAGFIASLVLIGEPHDFLKPVYLERPVAILVHTLFGVCFWVLMPFQFSPRLRQRRPGWHKASGRLAVLSAVALGASSVWLVVFFPQVGGALRQLNLLVSGLGTIAAFGYAIRAARLKDIAAHRAWMMRAVAIVYGAATTAIVGIPFYAAFGDFPAWMTEIDRWVGLGVNLCFVEWLLSRKPRAAAAFV